ncbi:MAG: site-specific integrase [Candidatus Thiodiazotropha sp.]
MPYKRKDSSVWWASYVSPDGKRVRRSTGTTDRKEAEALERKWKLEAYRAQQWDEQPERSFDELMLAYLKATGEEKRSADKDRQRTRKLRQMFGGRLMNPLKAVDVRDYITLRKRQGVSASTINRELALLSAAINYANREWDWGLPNITRGRKLREPEGRVRWISYEDGQSLIEAAALTKSRTHLPDFIRLALHTGCRKGELLGLEWRRVDLRERLIYLEAEHTKAERRRSVPLNDEAYVAIINRARFRSQHCPDSPWVFCNRKGERIKDVKRGFERACRLAEIEDFRIHDLRHTCAAWLVSAGAALAEVRDLLGHSTVTMTEKYAHLAPENIRGAVTLLDGVRSRSGHVVNRERKSKGKTDL